MFKRIHVCLTCGRMLRSCRSGTGLKELGAKTGWIAFKCERRVVRRKSSDNAKYVFILNSAPGEVRQSECGDCKFKRQQHRRKRERKKTPYRMAAVKITDLDKDMSES